MQGQHRIFEYCYINLMFFDEYMPFNCNTVIIPIPTFAKQLKSISLPLKSITFSPAKKGKTHFYAVGFYCYRVYAYQFPFLPLFPRCFYPFFCICKVSISQVIRQPKSKYRPDQMLTLLYDLNVINAEVQDSGVSFVQYKSYCNIIQMEDLQESSYEQMNFDLNEIVWAKITGYPWWPAKITFKPSEEEGHYRVDFLSDNSHAFVGQSKITKYDQMRGDIDIHKHLAKGLRKAINAADLAIQQLRTVVGSSRPAVMQVEACGRNQKQLLQSPLIEQTLLQEKLEQLPNQQNQSYQAQSIQLSKQQYKPRKMNQPFLYTRQQRQKYVNSLLNKYQLNFISRVTSPNSISQYAEHKLANRVYKKRSMNIRRANSIKQKKKINKQMKETPVHYLLARKINRLLKRKSELRQEQRQTISVVLAKEVLGQAGTHDELMRLFKWINISSCDTISNFYGNWTCLQSEKQKSSNMTVQEL